MEEKKDIAKTKKLPESGNWRKKLKNREEMLKYLQTAERYWFSKDWYGSERRKDDV